MKPFLTPVSLCLVCISSGLFSSAASAQDNITLNFTGTITNNPCLVDVSDASQIIALGDFNAYNFSGVGDMTPAQSFSINLDCPSNGPDEVSILFSGVQSPSDPTLLALDSGGSSATGVAIHLAENDGSQINIGANSATVSTLTGVNTLLFSARYQALAERHLIGPGTANATMQFTVVYP